MLDTQSDIVMHDLQQTSTLRKSEKRGVPTQDSLQHVSVSEVYAQQCVGLACVQALDANAFAPQAMRATGDGPALRHVCPALAHARRGHGTALGRQHWREGGIGRLRQWQAPLYINTPVLALPDLEQCRIKGMGPPQGRPDRERHQHTKREEQQHRFSPHDCLRCADVSWARSVWRHSMRMSYKFRRRWRPLASCAAARSCTTSAATCDQTASSGGICSGCWSCTQTRCRPKGETSGPAQVPSGKVKTRSAKSLPKTRAMASRDWARCSWPSGKGSASAVVASGGSACARSCARTASASVSRRAPRTRALRKTCENVTVAGCRKRSRWLLTYSRMSCSCGEAWGGVACRRRRIFCRSMRLMTR